VTQAVRWYRLGDAVLGVSGDDPPLAERFEEIYGECAIDDPGSLPRVRCQVQSTADCVTILFDDPEALDVARFVATAFPDRGYDAAEPGAAVVGRIRLPGESAELEVSPDGRSLRAAPDSTWRPLIANLAVSRTLRLQRDVLFFHAASVSVNGRGLLACGPKRAGKTTLAMTLASRGHMLFGDEMAAVRLASRELLPVRRSLAVRAGPAGALARAALDRSLPEVEYFPDGERRERVPIARIFPATPEQVVPLAAILLLRGFTSRASAEAALPGPGLVGQLTPLAASLWNRSPGSVMIHLMRLLSSTRVHWIDVGPPEETAELVERLLEHT